MKEKKNAATNEVIAMVKRRLNNRIKVIAIHGASTSGKTTFANNLYASLKEHMPTFLLHMDSYYKSFTDTDVTKYDFDNPSSVDWDKIHGVLRSIHDGDEFIPTYQYSFVSRKSTGPIMVRNNSPEVLIIEGIYALNLFNRIVFDTNAFDSYDSSKEGYKENENEYPDFGVLKIRLNICKNRMEHTRVCRDVLERDRGYLESTLQFSTQVWPATTRWVHSSVFKSNIDLVHGSFNTSNYKTLFKCITDCLTGNSLYLAELTNEFDVVDCSKECVNKSNSDLTLYDSPL
ncbi:Armadillo/beta-Catenin/plakoglobin [Trachipleistophora hominis]|uniref:Armadillo/beta-Catenin/plakoglobin n=1 Tax=Trachipleistophora hominis TaxID=72359 RepID=L7JTC4_TRAHO|nr:Armadillo/beta-Catenin/plakoglobin [Trachipleistophora hominis]